MMQLRLRQTLVLATALLLAVAPVLAQNGHGRVGRGHKREERQTIEQLERALQKAQLDGDTTTLEHLLSDDYLGISPNGELSTKAQQIDHMRARQLVITKYNVDDMKIKLAGATAIVTSEVELEGTIDGSPLHGRYRYMRVYQRVAPDDWRVTSFEATRVRPQDAAPEQAVTPPAASPGL